jgi:molybdate transport system substrate-binding protein
MKFLQSTLLFFVCMACSTLSSAEKIFVAAASNFTAPMKALAERFEQTHAQYKPVLSFGSSGKFFAQIQNGAPFQLFLSADQAKPEALENAGMTLPGTRFTYAIGALALWSAKAGFVDEHYTRLKTGDYHKLALANPKLAPYGLAAVEVLEVLNLKQTTQGKWVMGENIAQTYQFIASENADLGFVALSQIMENGQIKHGSGWIIPEQYYRPIRQDAVLLKTAADNAGALALFDFLKTAEARSIIHQFGYQTE